ncbi:MAG: DUF2254 family protein [Bacteroidota bacterium]
MTAGSGVFYLLKMVEITVRALSPDVNDPFTAIACIGNLTGTICDLTGTTFPSKYRVDDEGELRLIADVTNFDGIVNAAFYQV